jgi:hypothetical protein
MNGYGAPVPVHPTVSTAAPLHRQDTAVPVYMPEMLATPFLMALLRCRKAQKLPQESRWAVWLQ